MNTKTKRTVSPRDQLFVRIDLAGEILCGAATTTAYRLVEEGLISTIEIPGVRGKYVSVADLERIHDELKEKQKPKIQLAPWRTQ